MRLPRDVSGKLLVRLLQESGYVAVRQSGSHVRMTHPGREFPRIPFHGESESAFRQWAAWGAELMTMHIG